MRRRMNLRGCAAVVALVVLPAAHADWRDWLDVLKSEEAAPAVASLADSEIADGLRAALGQGVQRAVESLGSPDGFLANADVRIPVPGHLELVEKGLRSIGKDAIADQFVTSMNRAAERAVPEAASVFAGAISQMSIEDARGILNGGDRAATEFLKRSSNDELEGRFRPIVDAAMQQVGVTRDYQELLDKAGPVSALVDTDKLNLSGYVTDGALAGVYHMIGAEEQKIRENPAARTTDLLKKVFGR